MGCGKKTVQGAAHKRRVIGRGKVDEMFCSEWEGKKNGCANAGAGKNKFGTIERLPGRGGKKKTTRMRRNYIDTKTKQGKKVLRPEKERSELFAEDNKNIAKRKYAARLVFYSKTRERGDRAVGLDPGEGRGQNFRSPTKGARRSCAMQKKIENSEYSPGKNAKLGH